MRQYQLFVVSLGIILFLISCGAAETPTPTITKTAVSHPSPAPTSTALPPIATQTAVPIPTASATATPEVPTPTAVPTLVPKRAVSWVMDLLHNNHDPNCLLPCWWGIVPGRTDLYDVISYLKPFAYEIRDFSEHAMSTTFLVPESVDYTEKLYVIYGINTSKIVTSIRASAVNIEGYDPQTMMSLYGVPDEVWINTSPYVLQGDVLPFSLFIVYQEQGISLRYYIDASIAEQTVTACFKQGVVEIDKPYLFPAGPHMFLWEPAQSKTIDEIYKSPGGRPFPLEEKTELTPQTLYEKFTNPDEMPCIDTPSVLWD